MINKEQLQIDVQNNPEATIGELAKLHGSSYPAMSSALRSIGIRAKRKNTTKKRIKEGGRAFKVLAHLIHNPDDNYAVIGEIFNCTREYVSQIDAIARNEGIIK